MVNDVLMALVAGASAQFEQGDAALATLRETGQG